MKVLDCTHSMNAKNKFDSKIIEEGWNAGNDMTQNYYEDNKD